MPADYNSFLDLTPVSSCEPAAAGDVLSAWRKRAVPLDPVQKAMHQAILRAFAATGRPPKPAELDPVLDAVAPSSRRSMREVLQALHDLDAIRLGADGRIAVAYPFSATPTRHRVTLHNPDSQPDNPSSQSGSPGGEPVEVFAMCAIDALGMAAMLEVSTRIESVDVTTGTPITVTMSPHGEATWEPAEAVVFVGATAEGGPSADCCCDYLNFFTDPAAAKIWTKAHQQVPGQILDQAAAEQLGTDLFRPLLDD